LKYKQGTTYQFTNGSNIYAYKIIIHVLTNPLFLGLYIPCKRKGDIGSHQKLRLRWNKIDY
jgi:hypothetical protein